MYGMMNSWTAITEIPWKDILNAILTFLYSLAHYVGVFVVYLLGSVLPTAMVPGDLEDPIGYLAILTAFLYLVQVARKAAWVVLVVGWVLIAVRLFLGVVGF